jgi:hypothetical protein
MWLYVIKPHVRAHNRTFITTIRNKRKSYAQVYLKQAPFVVDSRILNL